MITWYKGDRILSAGSLKVLAEPRVKILPMESNGGRRSSSVSGVAVLIRKVRMDDQDDYVCQVNLKDQPISIKHKLEVLGELKKSFCL